MTAITGRTFPVRAQLRALGGEWDKAAQCWMVPDDKADEARRIVSTPVAQTAAAAGKAHYTSLGGGVWGVCVPESVPTAERMPGAVVEVLTKAGKVKAEVLGPFVKRTERGFVFQTVARVNSNSNAAKWGRYDKAKASLNGPGFEPDPGELAADRWNEGGGVA